MNPMLHKVLTVVGWSKNLLVSGAVQTAALFQTLGFENVAYWSLLTAVIVETVNLKINE